MRPSAPWSGTVSIWCAAPGGSPDPATPKIVLTVKSSRCPRAVIELGGCVAGGGRVAIRAVFAAGRGGRLVRRARRARLRSRRCAASLQPQHADRRSEGHLAKAADRGQAHRLLELQDPVVHVLGAAARTRSAPTGACAPSSTPPDTARTSRRTRCGRSAARSSPRQQVGALAIATTAPEPSIEPASAGGPKSRGTSSCSAPGSSTTRRPAGRPAARVPRSRRPPGRSVRE